MEDRHLSLSEVAGLMGVSERTVRRWIKSGKLKAYKPGRDYRIPESAIREFVEGSEISPIALRRSSLEPTLFNGLEEERRESIYGPWLEYANRLADRWEARIATGDFDLGNVNEFLLTLDSLLPTLSRLEKEEWAILPKEQQDEYLKYSNTSTAMLRLAHLYNSISETSATKFNNTELEQLRQKRAEQEATFGEAIRRGA
jgi:excisionase family DNA binding protein